ncbi:MAG: hypothetical protein CVU29_09730 [Betaproteobacteria bacterium HGW-Betaproteobacteria-22]|nr:MAG: hypothetical protein CVU29_09730 [Betaproteobacteria bacterium HGW-Betaproteobacteria-22]
MTKTEPSPPATDGLKSITGLTDQEFDVLTATLAKIRTPKTDDCGAHAKMLSAVRNQLQQRLNQAANLNDAEKEKLLNDIAELDLKINVTSH